MTPAQPRPRSEPIVVRPSPCRVQIVVDANGWILHRCAQELERHLTGVEINGRGHQAVRYYLPASTYWAGKFPPASDSVRIGFFTHEAAENLPSLIPLYDHHLAMNQAMAGWLRTYGADPVVIRPGSIPRKPITFGVCGKVYPSGRKGEELVRRMVQAGYRVRGWGEGWPCQIVGNDPRRLHEFYARIDYLVVTSTVEGGPMPVIDAISQGVPVIAPAVGWCWEYPTLHYEAGDWTSLERLLMGLTQPPTWQGWVDGHYDLFSRIAATLPADVPPPPTEPDHLPTVALTMRTANRGRDNYLGATVKRLLGQGLDPKALWVCATDPNVRWIERELPASITPIVPSSRLTGNANGLAQVRAVVNEPYDWVLMLEDDLVFCADFVGSVRRWLKAHARTDRHVYQFFGFARPPKPNIHAYDVPLKQLRASQAIALRMTDARDFLAWGDANLKTWRSHTPWGSTGGDPNVGFDKFVAAWALTRWPNTPGMMSHPHFVKHIGIKSSLHARGVVNDAYFAGERWRYEAA